MWACLAHRMLIYMTWIGTREYSGRNGWTVHVYMYLFICNLSPWIGQNKSIVKAFHYWMTVDQHCSQGGQRAGLIKACNLNDGACTPCCSGLIWSLSHAAMWFDGDPGYRCGNTTPCRFLHHYRHGCECWPNHWPDVWLIHCIYSTIMCFP